MDSTKDYLSRLRQISDHRESTLKQALLPFTRLPQLGVNNILREGFSGVSTEVPARGTHGLDAVDVGIPPPLYPYHLPTIGVEALKTLAALLAFPVLQCSPAFVLASTSQGFTAPSLLCSHFGPAWPFTCPWHSESQVPDCPWLRVQVPWPQGLSVFNQKK